MASLIINVGGKLDKSYESALAQAAAMAQRQQRQTSLARSIAPDQLQTVNRALAKLPAESLMRPRLESMKSALTKTLGNAGAEAGGSWMSKFLGKIQSGGGGMSQLIHVFRASFDSLVSGMNPWRVFLQQAPQAGQALTTMGGSIVRFFLNPITIGVAAATAVLGGLAWHLYKVAERARNLAAMLAPVRARLSDQTDAVLEANKQHREFLEYLRKIGTETNTLPEKLARVIKKLREEADLQKELARARGASAAQLERMSQQALEKELSLTTAAKLEARRAEEDAKLELDKREAAYNAGLKGKAADEAANEEARKAKALLDAAQKALEAKQGKSISYETGDVTYSPALHTMVPVHGERPYNESDKLTFDVEGKSVTTTVEAARKAYQEAKETSAEFEAARESLKTEFEKAKDVYSGARTATKSLTDQAQEVSDQLEVRKKYGAQVADATVQRSGGSSDLTANQRIGAFAFRSGPTLVNLTQTLVRQGAETNAHLRQISKQAPQDINGAFN